MWELSAVGLDAGGAGRWICVVCGFVYEQAQGLPDEGIAPGTHWDDVPAEWLCPDCGMGKADFEMIELD